MKFKLAIVVLIAVLAASLYAAPPTTRRSAPPAAARIDNATYINANRILMFVTNHGNFGRDLTDMFHQDAGTFYPYTTVANIVNGSNLTYVLYAAGLWTGGVVIDTVIDTTVVGIDTTIDTTIGPETRVAVAEYEDEYVPGPMADGTFLPDQPEFKVYKLYRDSLYDNPNEDYLNWPADMGAPTKIDTIDGEEVVVPDFIGDQMLWAVYNDADPAGHTNDAGETEPLGIEVRHTTFAFNQEGSLGDIIFFRLQVFNRGSKVIEDCYMSLWADPDLGGYTDDLVGCDTMLDLGFVYNSTNNDAQYGATCPSLGFDFFQGPLIPTGNPDDTARMWGQRWPGYVNMGMTSFNKYINGTDPVDFQETYNYMQGLDASGAPYIYGGNTLVFMHSGDPVAGTGDLDVNPADRRWMQTTGPITFSPGDSTEIIAAIVVGRGASRLNSISEMKIADDFAQRIYENDFQVNRAPTPPVVNVSVVPGEVVLSWGTISEEEPGDFPFQGYTVWQCETEAGPCVELATYDVIDSLDRAIIDTILDPYSQIYLPVVKRAVTNSGLKYVYMTDMDAITGSSLYDITTYYFRVTAFSYANEDTLGNPIPYRNRFLESVTPITVTPQMYLPGTTTAGDAGDLLPVTHVTGGSDVAVDPYILDPLDLNGHTYRVYFTEIDDGEGGLDTAWNLADVTAGEVLLADRMNYSGEDGGEEPYIPTDGFQLIVSADQGVVAIQEVAGAGGAIDPPDNVMYSLNSTRDWYVDTDPSGVWSRLNWRGHIGVSDWEFRFTAGGSEYYNWDNDEKWPTRAPFEVWNIGIGTPDDPSDDMRIQFAILDDDASGGWSYGDRMYPWDAEYPAEPLPDFAVYNWDADFHIGRIKIEDYSGATTAPAEGTVIRFVTAKVPTPGDTFTFVATAPTVAGSAEALDGIRVVPNPFYMFGPYDAGVGGKVIRFHGLPAECTIDIYNLAGEFIYQVVKNDASTSIAEWGAFTLNGLPVASGIYIYVVDAPGFGQKIGKFAVFTEVEVLKQY